MYPLLLLQILMVLAFCEAMTMKQLKNTGKMMRKSCQPKNNAADEKIDLLNNGVFIDEREVKCYVACIMKMASTMKNGKPNYEAAIKQADLLLPDEIKEPAKVAIGICRSAGEAYKDSCEAAYQVTKCIQKANPDIFFFP